MKKSIASRLLAIVLAVCLLVPSFAATASAASTYTVTYKSGDVGTFNSGYTDWLVQAYGANVTVNAARDNVKITVPAGSAYPSLPTDTDITTDGNAYAMLAVSEWGPGGAAVTRNEEYTVQYGKLVSGVEYTVRYVNYATGEQIATPEIAYRNVGDSVTQSAKNIADYALRSGSPTSKTIGVLDSNSENNIIEFEYEYTGQGGGTSTVIRYVDGIETVTYETVYIDNGEEENEQGEEEVIIPDEPIPEGNDDEPEETIIDDNDTPLAGPEIDDGNSNLTLVTIIASAVGALLIILLIIWFRNKNNDKKKAKKRSY